VGNSLDGRSRGVEVAANLQPMAAWRTHVSYTFLDVSVTRDRDSRDVGGIATEANDPRHLLALRTALDLPDGWKSISAGEQSVRFHIHMSLDTQRPRRG
jgi:outer membrane receptor protein involved in Fe transport